MGTASLGVSLPKEWLEHYGLKHGDEVEVEILPDYTLLIKPSLSRSAIGDSCRVLRYDDNAPNESIMKLISLYLNGIDPIRVVCGNYCSSFKEKVYRVIERNVVGLEVVDEGRGYITLACLADASSLPLSKVLRKMGTLIPVLLRDLRSAMETGEFLDMEERDSLLDRLYLYALRQLNMVMSGRLLLEKTGLRSMSEAIPIANLLKTLERIGDHIVQLHDWFTGARREGKALNNVITALDEIIPVAEMILNGYLVALKNPDKMLSIERTVSELKTVEERVRALDLDAVPLVNITRIIAYLMDIVEMVTDIIVGREQEGVACGEGPIEEPANS